MVLRFANFYYYFIQNFNKIAGQLTLMLKIVNSFENLLILKKRIKNNKLVVEGDKNKNLAKPRKSKNYPKLFKSKKIILDKSKILVNLSLAHATEYIILKAKVIFICLR